MFISILLITFLEQLEFQNVKKFNIQKLKGYIIFNPFNLNILNFWTFQLPFGLIEEVPAYTEMKGAGVDRVVGSPVVATIALVDMVHGQVDTAVLEV